MAERDAASAITRRIKRAEGWLSRCAAASGRGLWSSALMDAECAEAETRGLREELWREAEAEAAAEAAEPRGSRVIFGVRVTAIAAAILLCTGFPLAVEQVAPFGGGSAPGTIAILTKSESELIAALRDSLSRSNRGVAVVTMETAAPVASGAAEAARPAVRRQARPAAPPVPAVSRAPEPAPVAAANEREASRPRVAMDDVLALIQVGERALRMPDITVRGIR